MKKNNKGFYPEEIIFASTDSCNLLCPHCFVSRQSNRLDIDDCKKLILSAIPQIQKIGFSGGEPFLYKEFLFQIVKFTVENDLLFDQIMTNGDWWKSEIDLKQTLQELYDAGFDGKIGLSWDSFHNQKFERMKIFVDEVHAIFGSESLNIQYVKSENNQLLEEIKQVYPEISIYILEQSFTGDDKRSWNSKKWFKDDFCQGPGHILYVHPNGYIAPCCGFANENLELKIGTIKNTFEEILENAKNNEFVKLCYENGLSKAKQTLKQQGIKLPGKCSDICTFCDFVCKNLKK